MSDFTVIPRISRFPQLSDEQLETLESLGTRRKVNRGEIIYKTGQRDVPFHLVLSGELEVFESREVRNKSWACPGRAILLATSRCSLGLRLLRLCAAKLRNRSFCKFPRHRFRRALAEIPSVSETIVSAPDHATQTSAARS